MGSRRRPPSGSPAAPPKQQDSSSGTALSGGGGSSCSTPASRRSLEHTPSRPHVDSSVVALQDLLPAAEAVSAANNPRLSRAYQSLGGKAGLYSVVDRLYRRLGWVGGSRPLPGRTSVAGTRPLPGRTGPGPSRVVVIMDPVQK